MESRSMSFLRKATKNYNKLIKLKGDVANNLNQLKKQINNNFRPNRLSDLSNNLIENKQAKRFLPSLKVNDQDRLKLVSIVDKINSSKLDKSEGKSNQNNREQTQKAKIDSIMDSYFKNTKTMGIRSSEKPKSKYGAHVQEDSNYNLPYGHGEEITRNKVWYSLDNFKADSNASHDKEKNELHSLNLDLKELNNNGSTK